MKWLLLIPFQLEAVKRKPASGLNNWAVMFWTWEPLWRQLWNFHVFCPHLIEIECPDSSLAIGRRQVRIFFSDFIIFVASLIVLLTSMLYGHLKQPRTSLASVPISEASWGKWSDINIYGSFLPRNHLKRSDPGNRLGSLPSIMCLIYRQDKPKYIPLCCISLSLCTNITVFKTWESLCVQRFSATQILVSASLSLSHPQSQLLSSTGK